MASRDEYNERTRAVNKVRAGVQDRQDKQNQLAADTAAKGSRQLLGKAGRRSGSAFAPIFNPKADISKGIARRADPGDPHESPNNFKPLPGAPIDYNAGKPDRGPKAAKQARDKVAARRYPNR
jgi:hypothetical protein